MTRAACVNIAARSIKYTPQYPTMWNDGRMDALNARAGRFPYHCGRKSCLSTHGCRTKPILLKGTLVSLHLLREQLCRYQEDDSLPIHWTFDSLGLWCRMVARHNEGLLSDTEEGVLKDMLRRYIARFAFLRNLSTLKPLYNSIAYRRFQPNRKWTSVHPNFADSIGTKRETTMQISLADVPNP
jgi:hypothetical protein